jgi:hypothetical protein
MFPLIAVATLLGACGGNDSKSSADPKIVAAAEQVWKTKCSTCHGAQGLGDGAAGQALNPRPRSFHDHAWQNKVTDDHIKKVIVEGGAAVGLSPNMAPNPELRDKPEVVAELVKKIRAFGG